MKQDFFSDSIAFIKKYVDEEHGGNIASASQSLGMTGDTLYKWLTGKRSPKLELIGPVLEKLGVSLAFPGHSRFATPKEDFALVPKVEALAGAGESLATSDAVEGYYAFRADFMRQIGVSPHNAVMMDVIGDSMEPLIRQGDTLLIDQAKKEPHDGQIFLLNLEGALMVKRLIKIPGGWRIHSENRMVSDIDVTGEELNNLYVFGRVRWAGRVF